MMRRDAVLLGLAGTFCVGMLAFSLLLWKLFIHWLAR